MQHYSEQYLLLNKKLGEILKKLREEKTGLSATKFAYSYDMEKSNVIKIEGAKVFCKLITIWKIANALGIKCSELIALVEKELGDNFTLIDE